MKNSLVQWLRIYYSKIISSIAFYPALMALGFLLLSLVMLEIDFSAWGKDLKATVDWLHLKDASTARTIVGTVAAAVISLTVFSFSMVMIVLNQAGSQMSNRVLTSMIENRFQQVVLGFYIGTIVYALFLLSTIRDTSNGIYIPALSIYLLIILTVIDIFLFIYFLDYVTQTVKFETVIERVMKQTFLTLKKDYKDVAPENGAWERLPFVTIKANQSNYFQNFNEEKLLEITSENNVFITFLYPRGTFVIEGTVLMKVYAEKTILDDCLVKMTENVDFYGGQPIALNADYGFKQLAEIAIKALSPGINDPGTAIIALHSITALLNFRLTNNLPTIYRDKLKVPRIYVPVSTFETLFETCYTPIWNYGKNDVYIQNEMLFLIQQLKNTDQKDQYTDLLDGFLLKIEKTIHSEPFK
jgi:uncharacterized membrane protein